MSIQVTQTRPTPLDRRQIIAKAWRRWWLRAAHRKQMRRLDEVTMDPHMARDLGMPVRERPAIKYGLM